MIELTIPEATPSLNRMLGQHWAHKHELRKRWAWLVRAALLEAKIFERPRYARATVTIERTAGRKIDFENAMAGTKFLTDSLVQEGFILDDSPEIIGHPVLHQIIDKRLRQTRVRIEPVLKTISEGLLERHS